MFLASDDVEKKFYKKGEPIFEEGEEGTCAYIVEMGKVEIYKKVEGETVLLAAMGEGELFGEMAVIDGSPRMANARAAEDSVVVSLPQKLFDSKLQKYDPLMRSLIQILLDNLRNVHKSYMHRPRSVDDYLNAMAFHSDGFQRYLAKFPASAETANSLVELGNLDQAIQRLREQFKDHQDPRASALFETDVSRTLGKGRDKGGRS